MELPGLYCYCGVTIIWDMHFVGYLATSGMLHHDCSNGQTTRLRAAEA